jgi:hypothetical protein
MYEFENHLIQQDGITFTFDGGWEPSDEDGRRGDYAVRGGHAEPDGIGAGAGGDSVERIIVDLCVCIGADQQVTDTYDYDAFGNLIHSTGITPNNYLHSGEAHVSA